MNHYQKRRQRRYEAAFVIDALQGLKSLQALDQKVGWLCWAAQDECQAPHIRMAAAAFPQRWARERHALALQLAWTPYR